MRRLRRGDQYACGRRAFVANCAQTKGKISLFMIAAAIDEQRAIRELDRSLSVEYCFDARGEHGPRLAPNMSCGERFGKSFVRDLGSLASPTQHHRSARGVDQRRR